MASIAPLSLLASRPSPRRSFRQYAEAGPATEHEDQGPARERDPAREPRRQREVWLDVPFLYAAHRDELEDEHVNAGRRHDRHLAPECRGDEVLGGLADEEQRAGD